MPNIAFTLSSPWVPGAWNESILMYFIKIYILIIWKIKGIFNSKSILRTEHSWPRSGGSWQGIKL